MTQSDGFAGKSDRCRLLCIDDNDLALKSLSVLLQTMGYEVDSTDNALTALAMFSEDQYDLVITDLNMPGITGLRVTEEIKRINPATPVIVLSGSINMDADGQASHVGPDCVMIKPLVFSEFVDKLNQLLPAQVPEEE